MTELNLATKGYVDKQLTLKADVTALDAKLDKDTADTLYAAADHAHDDYLTNDDLDGF